MTVPSKPVTVNERQPWTARMLDATTFTKVGRGRQPGYDIGEVDSFKKRAVVRVAELEGQLGVARTTAKKANDALAAHVDAAARASHPWEKGAVPEGAVDAMVQGQQLAERHDRNANAEIARRLANADRAQREADDLLARAKVTATEFDPPALTLPDPPDPTGDVAADLEAKAQHAETCSTAMKAWEVEVGEWQASLAAEIDRQRAELAERREAQEREAQERQRALVDQRAELVAELDRITEAAPAVRDRVAAIDLTEPAGDGEERVAS